ncbi:YitT family protein [Desulfosarcina sp.]|uniref:YitT family protein n=1 Tax=Desulfosarcina sp. TaxID=2027861 RepID=UPI0029B3D55F|nr:YitT family protein [Desulfosarcina sp.]MDX2451146.1 YitT family protein [Desulfosarcina sp.]MDX2488985.1 YitT family protein [Desulfosarcina sp.]
MKTISKKAVSHPIGQVLLNLLLLTLGSMLCAMAINGILIPNGFLSSGLTGLVLILHYLFPFLPVAALYFLLNVPVFILGWKFVGRRFFFYSIAGMTIFSVCLAWAHASFPVQDMLCSALLAGILSGVGGGITLKSLGSAGGTDILSVALLKRFSVRIGTTTLAFNCIVLLAGALLFPLEKVLYTLIYIYVSTRILNLVITGLSQRKAVMIVSNLGEAISRKILEDIKRGVTVLRGQGAYSGRDEKVLYTVVNFRELARVKQLIRQMDPQAFVVVSDTLEVMGQRIGNQPQY